MARSRTASPKDTQAALGFEAKLWLAADKLRNNMDAAEYKHVVLGLIFLKYISDAFEDHRAKLVAGKGDYKGANPEDPDEYRAEHVFWVPPGARWSYLQASAKQPTIGKIVDDAMAAIERDNPRLKGSLNKNYGRADLDQHRLGELIDLIGTINLIQPSPPAPSPSERGDDKHYRGAYDFSGLVERARELRKKQTPAEELLWQLLRDRQLCDAKFRRQHQFGDYLCDFYCDEAKLVVECDGPPHAAAEQQKHDAKRDAYLKSQGLTVLRFKNEQVLTDTGTVLSQIAVQLRSVAPSPSPIGRGVAESRGEDCQEIGRQPAKSAPTHRSQDILGRVFEYFLTMFASAEGKNGGQFYTPSSVVRVLVEMLAPYKGRIYDPACGSGGMFVQSEKFVEAHGGKLGDISIYGQESNPTTRRLAIMNLAIRGIEADFGPEHADTFRRDLHPDLRADYVIANPPFNDSDWFRKEDDVRWRFGVPPKGNANFAWVQHFIHHLAPHGTAGFVLANGSMSSNQSGEGEIRRAIIEADLVDCMVALPGQLFYSTPIPVCLWILAKNKAADRTRGLRDRRKQTLFIDARKMGTLVDRVHRELDDDDLTKITSTYHAWRDEKGSGQYKDVAGFCKSVTTAEIAAHGHILTPGRHVGAEEAEEDGEPFDEKMARLTADLSRQFAESATLKTAIKTNLRSIGHGLE